MSKVPVAGLALSVLASWPGVAVSQEAGSGEQSAESDAGVQEVVVTARRTRERLQDELVDIWSRTGLTVIFVTHSIEEAIFLADRVVVMSPGPGRIDNEYGIDLPRPRDIASPEFNEWRRLLSSQLHSHHGRKAG